mmetsp:Transcript_14068/g.16104  ORF Transcript_14068/g.16104 Transcript_14068/m.16104 type:complete len:91 (+) Transcript_14068:320-592(+)
MLSQSLPSSSFLTPRSLLFISVVIASSEAKLLRTIVELFKTPHSLLLDQQQQVMDATRTTDLYDSSGQHHPHAADKTREFLACGEREEGK